MVRLGWSCVLSLLLLSTGNYSYGYSPLLNSDWAKEHKGQLPISSCKVTSNLKLNKLDVGTTAGLFLGGTYLPKGFVSCISEQTQLGFAIPIQSIKILNTLSFAPIPTLDITTLTLDPKSLDGKSVSSLLNGTFRGTHEGLSTGAGAALGTFWTSDGIRASLERITLSLGFELSLGYSSFSIALRDIKETDPEYLNPFVLLTTSFLASSKTSKPIKNRLADHHAEKIKQYNGSVLVKRNNGTLVWEGRYLSLMLRDRVEKVDPKRLGDLQFRQDVPSESQN